MDSRSELDRARALLETAGIAGETQAGQTLGLDRQSPFSGLPSHDSLPPGSIGASADCEFVLRRTLGRGGMSEIYLAEQRTLRREVALKRTRRRGREAEAMLVREAVITGRLEHPNILPIHALVTDSEGPAVVMKRVSGVPWETLLLRGTEAVERHMEIFIQVCNAVAFAHSRGIVHLDIKPANVMIGDFGEVYLMDWGLARLISDPPVNGVVGTPSYMAPEMTRGEGKPASDVFLLGATLYEILTGWVLHDASDALGAVAKAMACEPPEFPDDVSEELALICRRALKKDPQERFAHVSELRDAVAVYREHRAASGLCQTASERGARLEVLTRSADSANYREAQALFNEARFAYEQALKTWPESEDGRRGLSRTLCTMIEYELALEHPDTAASLLEILPDPPPALRERVERSLEQASQAEHRLAELERDADPAVGAADRLRAFLAFMATVLVMTAVLGVSRALRPDFSPSSKRLAYVGGFVLAAMGMTVLAWRRAGWNLVNRRIALIALSTLMVSFLNRLAGVVGGVPSSQVLVGDAFIVGLGGMGIALFHPAGYWLSMLSFTVGLVGAALPLWIDDMFVGLSLVIPAVLLILRGARRTS